MVEGIIAVSLSGLGSIVENCKYLARKKSCIQIVCQTMKRIARVHVHLSSDRSPVIDSAGRHING